MLRGLAGAGADHDSHVVALGGGVVGDLAGFCAASYQRGIPVVQVPTTLVAQVDSAYGGKTGVDLPEGKNYAGAYHQPAAVLADPATLATLPPAELAAGWAEVIKTALIAGGPLWQRVRRGDVRPDRDLVLACARTKLRVVEQDERDGGRRQALNLGHTVGHAIETATGYARYRHGEAVGARPARRARRCRARASCATRSPACSGSPGCRRALDPRRRPRGRARRRAARQEAPRRARRLRAARGARRRADRLRGRRTTRSPPLWKSCAPDAQPDRRPPRRQPRRARPPPRRALRRPEPRAARGQDRAVRQAARASSRASSSPTTRASTSRSCTSRATTPTRCCSTPARGRTTRGRSATRSRSPGCPPSRSTSPTSSSREPFRRTSVLEGVVVARVSGQGVDGYRVALERIKAAL